MWLFGGIQAAADVPASGGASDQLIITVGAVITAAIVALGGVMVAVVNSRGGKTTPSPPAPATSADEHVLYERTAVHNKRLDDNDDRFDVLDRLRAGDREDLDDVIDYLDDRDPGWRR